MTAMTHDSMLGVLIEQIELVAPHVDLALVSTGQTLSQLGCNSIDRAEIVSLTMQALDVDIPLHLLHSKLTIADLLGIFDEHGSS